MYTCASALHLAAPPPPVYFSGMKCYTVMMILCPNSYVQIPQWYHFSCFFKKKILKAVNEVSGFGILRDEDQQKIRAKITGEESTDSPSSSSKKGRKTVITRSDLQVEYAKSNRSQCKSCSSRIEKVLLDEQSANTGLCELDWVFYVQYISYLVGHFGEMHGKCRASILESMIL